MNEDELRAYGLLAQAIARHIFAQAERDDTKTRKGTLELRDAPWPIYYHYSTSTFERATGCLLRLGILRGVGPHAETIPFFFVFKSKVDDAAEIAVRHWQSGPSLEELLITFIDLFRFYGAAYWGFSTERGTPFGAGSKIPAVLDALGALGYLVKSDKGFVWMECAAGAMQAAGYWQD